MGKHNHQERLERRRQWRWLNRRYEKTPKLINGPVEKYWKTRIFCKRKKEIKNIFKPRESAHRRWLHNLTLAATPADPPTY